MCFNIVYVMPELCLKLGDPGLARLILVPSGLAGHMALLRPRPAVKDPASSLMGSGGATEVPSKAPFLKTMTAVLPP